jgi:hypothetical protein
VGGFELATNILEFRSFGLEFLMELIPVEL